MRKDSFERFYYEKVGLGEGCGCAEHVTRLRDRDALSEQLASGRAAPGVLSLAVAWLRHRARWIAKRRRIRQQA